MSVERPMSSKSYQISGSAYRARNGGGVVVWWWCGGGGGGGGGGGLDPGQGISVFLASLRAAL